MADSRLARLWRRGVALVDGTRRLLLNLLFIGLLVALGVLAWSSRTPALAAQTTLVLDLRGALVEQRSGAPREALLQQVGGDARPQTRLRDVLKALDAAAADPQIHAVLLTLDELGGAGLASLREVSAALNRFKASGKPVIAWGVRYDQRAYHLAAQADQIWLDPMGAVQMEGYGRYRTYYRDALDRLGISANVLRVGRYKNFGEPFFANAPSKETLEADGALYGDLWRTYTTEVERARKLPAGSIAALIEQLPQRLTAAGGDLARLAVDARLVDALKTRQEMRTAMIERGAKNEDGSSFRQINLADYVARQPARRGGPAIGVVVAEGEISDGQAPPGAIGGRSTAELIRKARDNNDIKAVVLRVNSPGGSAFGAELVRRELELTRAAGKPVVVSMGDVAASGGYWISMSADEVFADPGTITGSIGVFAMLPTAEKAMDKLSLHTGGSGTTWLIGAYDPRRGLDPRLAGLVQQVIGRIYTDFTGKAAAARKTTPEKIDALAQGRVWTGAQALERGLVDAHGGLLTALQSAARRAQLDAQAPVQYIEADSGRWARVLDLLGLQSGWDHLTAPLAAWLWPEAGSFGGLARQAQQELAWLAELRSGQAPYAAVTHCLCSPP